MAYEDDASRFITGFAVSDCLTAELHAQVLQGSVKRYGRPVTLVASYDSTFCSVESMKRDGGITELEKFILKNKIRLVLSVVRRRASGKIDKFFSLLESVANYFSSMEEFATWYNCVRPHGGIGLRTPLQAYYQRLPQADMIAFPSFMENEPSGKLFFVIKEN